MAVKESWREEEILTTDEACLLMRVSRPTFGNMIKNGVIPKTAYYKLSNRFYRFYKAELLKVNEKRKEIKKK